MNDNVKFKNLLAEKLAGLDENASLEEIQNLTDKFYSAQRRSLGIWRSVPGKWVFGIGIIFGIFCLLASFGLFEFINIRYLKCFYAIWVIAPPCWFMLEYVFIFPEHLKYDKDALADLKYVHELASKIWAGLILIIAAQIFL